MATNDIAVGLFVFDRPKHTKQVLNGLRKNSIDHLYVFSDGPRNKHDRKYIEKTRKIIKNIDFCTVDLIARQENYGVEKSWIKAYEYVFDRHEKAIMLEDDCVPGEDFVQYMRACLNKYESNETVMNVQGYSPPIEIPDDYPYDVYFTWRSGSWGQGTWKKAWEKLCRDPTILQQIKNEKNIKRKVERAGWDLIPMIEKEIADEIDSIGVWWSITLALNSAVSVNPIHSRIKNIGHDGSGVHSSETEWYLTDLKSSTSTSELSFPPSVTVNQTINNRYNYHIGGGFRGKIGRILERLRRRTSL